VTAAALITARTAGFASPLAVQVQGGDMLEVSFADHGGTCEEVCLTGPADFVFDGRIAI
jgi:diaminopimelate epimerase